MKHPIRSIVWFILLTFLLAACDDIPLDVVVVTQVADVPQQQPITEPAAQSEFSQTDVEVVEIPSWYEIYFTNPSCLPEPERSGGIDEIIAADLLTAQHQVDMAAFDFDSVVMTDALIQLEEQGVIVRVVTDEDNEDLSAIRRLRRGGISVVTDGRSALMHNKFIVIDGAVVWMGSMNFTTNGVYCNNNNIVRLVSPELAANYTTEMDEMYIDRQFGPRSPENTPNERLTINGVAVENYFAPEKELIPIIAEEVAKAQEEVLFMAFSFTNNELGETMIERAQHGVKIEGVFETFGSDTQYSYYPILKDVAAPNIMVRQDGNNYIMHHKVIIIDQSTLIFGSFNFSNSANDSNDENILMVHDPVFTSFFVEEFGFIWQEAKPGP